MANSESGKNQPIEFLVSDRTKELGLPFSDAVRVGNVIHVSGNIGVTPATMELVPGGVAAETKQILENIRGVLERSGSSMDKVIKCIVMMADMSEWAEMNKVYVTFFPENLPARSAFGTTGLVLGARVEIECIATV